MKFKNMLAANKNNEFLYNRYLPYINLETPYTELEDAIDSIGFKKKHCIDNIFILDTGVVLVGNSIASSFVKNNLLVLRNKNNLLQDTGNCSVFSYLSIPFILRKNFHKNYKEEALKFFNSLLNIGSVSMQISHKLHSSIIKNIDNQEQFEKSWSHLQKKYHNISLLNTPKGDIFKIFIYSGEVIGIYGIVPPFVIGDGVSSIDTLVSQIKTQRSKNILYKNYLLNDFDNTLHMEFIPSKGQIIKLKNTYEIENGALFINMTEALKGGFESIAFELKKILNDNLFLEITAFSEDIEKGIYDSSFIISEIKQSNIDLRDLLSGLPDKNQFEICMKKIFFNKSVLENDNDFGSIVPDVYNNGHFSSGNVEYVVKEAAHQLGLKVNQLDSLYWEIRNEVTDEKVLFLYGMSEYTTTLARRISNDKYKTKRILQNWGINSPDGKLFNINSKELAWNTFISTMIKNSNRVVLKPLDGQRAQGVTTDISNYEEFNKAWTLCENLGCKNVIAEEQLTGDEYRIIVIQNKVCAVSQRVAASVTGDGKHTIRELVSLKNIRRYKNVFLRKYPIKITDQVIDFLSKRDLSLDYIPLIDEKIKLSEIVNASAGGDIIDRTIDLHPDWVAISVNARKAIANAYHVGLDIIMTDITRSPNDQKWAIIEVNTNPGFGIQLFPTEGKPRNIGKVYLESIFGTIESCKVCYNLTIFGKVQNVGFRRWFKKLCDDHLVVGFVKNKKERNQVEAMIIGSKMILNEIIKKSYEGPKLAKVDTINWQECDIDNSYERFYIS